MIVMPDGPGKPFGPGYIDGYERLLMSVLIAAQMFLIGWLSEKGYTVAFS